MITRHCASRSQFLSLFYVGKPGNWSFSLLVSVISSFALLTGCEKTEEEPVAQNSPSNTISAVQSPTPRTDKKYEFGSSISFGVGGGSERFKQAGWSGPEKEAAWTTADSAKLVLSIEPSDQPLNLRMRLAGFTNPPEVPFQPVEVLANGQKIAEWQVSEKADFAAVIPAAIIKEGGDLTIELKIPKAVSPKSIGRGGDPRLLGVFCFELALTKGG